MAKRVTTQDFIRRAREVHGNRYDYSKSVYVAARQKLTIICPIHGEFQQQPSNHCIGRGCQECGGNKPLTIERFVERAKAKHGDKYDYSLVSFQNVDSKVDIICPDHGVFSQWVMAHLKGFGCQRCGWDSATRKRAFTTEQFIKDASNIHNHKYDYSLTQYVNANALITIICPVHGEFEQHAGNHVRGIGCSKCSDIVTGEKRRRTTEDYIAEARSVHGDKYDYSSTEYSTMHDKVEIVCSEHGSFWQLASNHIKGTKSGCPGCAVSGFDQTKPALLYYLAVLTEDGHTLYKIGITNLTVEKRFPRMDLARIRTIQTWEYEYGGDAALSELDILKRFSEQRYLGPDVLVGSGNTELFTTDVLGLDNDPSVQSYSQWLQKRLDL